MVLNVLSRRPVTDHRTKLIEALVGIGVLPRDVAADLKSNITNWPDEKQLTLYLTSRNLVDDVQINRAYAQIFHLPFINLPEVIDDESMMMIPKDVCLDYKIIAYRLADNVLYIAVADPLHVRENQTGVLADLKKEKELKFNLSITSDVDFQRWIADYDDDQTGEMETASEASNLPNAGEGVNNDQEPSIGAVSLEDKQIKSTVLNKLPYDLAKHYRTVVFDHLTSPSYYYVAAEDPSNRSLMDLLDYIEQNNNVKIKIFKTSAESIDYALKLYNINPFSVAGDIATAVKVSSDLLVKIPYEIAKKYRFIVFERTSDGYKVATDLPSDPVVTRILKYIENRHSININLFRCPSAIMDDFLKQYSQIEQDEKSALVTPPQLKELPLNWDASKISAVVSSNPNSIIIAQTPVQLHSEQTIIQTVAGEGQKPIPIKSPDKPNAKIDKPKKPVPQKPNDDEPEDKDKEMSVTEKILTGLGINKILSRKIVDANQKDANQQPAAVAATVATPKPPVAVPVVQKAQSEQSKSSAAPAPAQPSVNDPGDDAKIPATEPPKKDEDDDLGAMLDKDVETPAELDQIIAEGSIPKIVAAVVSYAITLRASDVHIEAEEKDVRVRYRVDGMLKDITKLSSDQDAAIVSRIKILSKLKIDETRIPQDGRFDVKFSTRAVDLRVSCMPMVHGEKIVMRILDKTHGVKTLEDLGVVGRAFDVIIEGISKPFGIVLSTGPTGSGKSTTLYAILNRISTPDVNIITLEDPVEYEIAGVNQSQIKPKIGFTFAEGLRSVLRQDPNIIMVGEIRDNETASMATHAALTGHLVLSTLHTNDAPGALPRLINMGIEPFLITSSINVVEAQRLVRKICQNCKEEVTIPQAVLEQIKAELDLIPENNPKDKARYITPMKFFHGRGCDQCQNGFVGRIGIYEVMPMSDAIEELAVSRSSATEINKVAIKEGMITMKQDGLLKALGGLTTVDEVLRETSE